MSMNRAQLIDAVLDEMERVWGDEGLGGSDREYRWLASEYGITEEEDVQWQLVFQYDIDDMLEEDLEDDEVMTFLEDDLGVVLFLERFLAKYRSSEKKYPR